MQTDLGREKKLRERLEVQCHELEREIETVRRSGSRPSQHSETAKEVAKYVFAVEISVFLSGWKQMSCWCMLTVIFCPVFYITYAWWLLHRCMHALMPSSSVYTLIVAFEMKLYYWILNVHLWHCMQQDIVHQC